MTYTILINGTCAIIAIIIGSIILIRKQRENKESAHSNTAGEVIIKNNYKINKKAPEPIQTNNNI